MEERNDWEKLNHIIEDYEPDPDLAFRAIEKINQRESTVTFKKAPNKQVILAVSLVGLIIAVFLAIFLPLYLTRNRVQILLYSEDEVEYSFISDIDSFIQEENLNIKYFSGVMSTYQVATIKQNNNIAFVMQDCFFVSSMELDNVNLKAVVLQNAEFDFYKLFNTDSTYMKINNISVAYNVY